MYAVDNGFAYKAFYFFLSASKINTKLTASFFQLNTKYALISAAAYNFYMKIMLEG